MAQAQLWHWSVARDTTPAQAQPSVLLWQRTTTAASVPPLSLGTHHDSAQGQAAAAATGLPHQTLYSAPGAPCTTAQARSRPALCALDACQLCSAIYGSAGTVSERALSLGLKLYAELDCKEKGLRVMALVEDRVPGAHCQGVAFKGTKARVVFVVRGTVVENSTNLTTGARLAATAALSGSYLPHADLDYCVGWALGQLQQLTARHPNLVPEVETTGHSLGALVAQVLGVRLPFALLPTYRCVTFEGPGLPDALQREALAAGSRAFWKDVMTEYLSWPNPINMLFPHNISSVYHVRMQLQEGPSHTLPSPWLWT
mmetsp:Transcript_3679/g.7938  ORF Transcript_3679/g.7938 Transcript_3679/m.7938 type:complete len:315 (+) Transcript_3679:257-1201(+)